MCDDYILSWMISARVFIWLSLPKKNNRKLQAMLFSREKKKQFADIVESGIVTGALLTNSVYTFNLLPKKEKKKYSQIEMDSLCREQYNTFISCARWNWMRVWHFVWNSSCSSPVVCSNHGHFARHIIIPIYCETICPFPGFLSFVASAIRPLRVFIQSTQIEI